jgi:hypothetical protein
VRARGGADLGALPVDRVLADLAVEIASRSVTLTVGRSGSPAAPKEPRDTA